ncbi:MAG: c-type cytochrome biogenesis protein CcmI [Candidatus Dormibacteraeota bacterium]|nr:c-type cytochrome biogenesis protein CcmI [Candidatus Dormibacteraeota bacterium]
MTWYLATAVLVVAAAWVLWPLIRHWQPRPERALTRNVAGARERELEEIELDLAAGRLGEAEAARRRRELG